MTIEDKLANVIFFLIGQFSIESLLSRSEFQEVRIDKLYTAEAIVSYSKELRLKKKKP